MAENKFGLHKEVSAIFDGIPLPMQGSNVGIAAASRYVQPLSSVSTETATAEIPTAPIQKSIPEKSENMSFGNFKQLGNKMSESILGLKIENKKQIAMIGLAAVLSLILAFILLRGTGTKHKNYIHKNPVGAKAGLVPQIKWQPPAEYLSNMRDPMLVGSSKGGKSETGDVVIKGIVYSKGSPTVIIDGLILNEGDKISGVTVVKINPDTVELKKDGKVWTQQVQ